jgi:hydrogenase small subunit
MQSAYGNYVLVVDGSIPARDGGAWSTIGGISNRQMLQEAAEGAALVVAMGTCAAFGGLPMAAPNPSDAAGVGALMRQGLIAERPLVNVSGCPPVPEVISGVIAYFLAFGALPELDALNRPRVYFGKTVHECCSRLPHYQAGNFAQSFDDDGARQGHCLFLLGCKGPVTFNACATVKWNQGTSFPMHSGHPCLGCAEPGFWDQGSFYTMLMADPALGDGTPCGVPPQPQL